jgi:putative ABC transport system permease protein
MLADLRFAVRQLAKSPGFALIAILTLALGIGSATTAFSALNALLLRPLPFIQHQDRMLWIDEAIPAKDVDQTDICYADFLEWKKRTQTLSSVWVYAKRTIILGGTDSPEHLVGAGLTPGAFQAMGVQPIRGRNFLPEDYDPKAEAVVLLGYDLWQRKLGGSDDVIGQVVKLNSQPAKVIGIMPRGWRYPDMVDLWEPFRADAAEALRHGTFHYGGHAMLKPGVTLQQAKAEFATISAALAKEFPTTNEGLVATLREVREEAASTISQLTLLLFGAVMFVFLIACANVANLLLARASSRTREIAIRLALGASRARLLRQLLVESLLLSLLGGAGGLLLGLWGVDLMLTAIPVELPFWVRFGYDPRVFGFVVALAFLASLLCGFVPAWQASRPEMIDDIKDGGRSGGGARGHRVRHTLVVAEIALALVLLIGAGLMMRSFLALSRVAPGFDARGIVTFRVAIPDGMIAGAPDASVIFRGFFRDLMPRLAALPGVESVSGTSALPGLGIGGFNGVLIEGQPVPKSFADDNAAQSRLVMPEFFETFRIPIRAGRSFTAADDRSHPLVAIIDEVFAHKFFPNQDPIGKRFRLPGEPRLQSITTAPTQMTDAPRWYEIVGVAGSARRWVDRTDVPPTFYTAYDQGPSGYMGFMSVIMRVRGDPTPLLNADGPLRRAVLAVNPEIPIYLNYTMEDAINRSDNVWKRHFFSYLFGAFAGVALLLASIGIYGVMAFSVAQRTQEIGVRMALGAQPGDVVRMVVRQGATLVALGLAIGSVAAYFTAQLLAGSLYGVSPHDPLTFVLVPLLLATVALLACLIPARRATEVDPIIALRAE